MSISSTGNSAAGACTATWVSASGILKPTLRPPPMFRARASSSFRREPLGVVFPKKVPDSDRISGSEIFIIWVLT